MRIFVKAKPNSKFNKVVAPEETLFQSVETKRFYTVHVKESPVNGKANDALVRELALFFKCARSQVVLVSGATSKSKVFEIKV